MHSVFFYLLLPFKVAIYLILPFFSVYILFISHFSLGEFWFYEHLICLEGAAAAAVIAACADTRTNMQYKRMENIRRGTNNHTRFYFSRFKYKIAACECAIRDLVFLALAYNENALKHFPSDSVSTTVIIIGFQRSSCADHSNFCCFLFAVSPNYTY